MVVCSASSSQKDTIATAETSVLYKCSARNTATMVSLICIQFYHQLNHWVCQRYKVLYYLQFQQMPR
jgi:hypothetical protein